MKRILKYLLILIGLLIIALIAFPFFFKDKVKQIILNGLNENLHATVSVKEVDLSLLKSFPKLNVSLHELSIQNESEFDSIYLFQGDRTDMAINLSFLYKAEAPLEIYSMNFSKPVVNVWIKEDGTANYNIFKNTSDTENSEYEVLLNEYMVSEGNLVYYDERTNTNIQFKDIDHEGQGAFDQEKFDLSTLTKIASATTSIGPVTYLNSAEIEYSSLFKIDHTKNQYSIDQNNLRINGLNIQSEGVINERNPGIYDLDIFLTSVNSDLKELISLIPTYYNNAYADLITKGKFKLLGKISGEYNSADNSFPSFNFNVEINRGELNYPQLKHKIEDIFVNAEISSPNGSLDNMKVLVPYFQLKAANDPISGKLTLNNLGANPYIDTKLKGNINLDNWSDLINMEGNSQVSGKIVSDIMLNGFLSHAESGQYDKITATGNVEVNDIIYRTSSMPDLLLKKADINLAPEKMIISSMDMSIGESDLKGSGEIKDYLSYFSGNQPALVSLNTKSRRINVNEWISEESEEAQSTPDFPFLLSLEAQAEEVLYQDYQLKGTSFTGSLDDSNIRIKNISGKLNNSDFKLNGILENYLPYAFENQVLSGQLNLSSDNLILDDFSSESDSGEGVVRVPENVNIQIKSQVDRLQYEKWQLKNANGGILIDDQSISLNNLQAKGMGGTINLNGSYITKDREKPFFDISYDMLEIGFQKLYDEVVTFQWLAPVSKYIEGQFNSSAKFSGELDNDYFPVIESLDASGIFNTINGYIRNFKPLDLLAEKINLEEKFRRIKFEDLENYFNVVDGYVIIDEFMLNADDIPLLIKGKHGIKKDMDYSILAKIPREYLKLNSAGKIADQGLTWIEGHAAKAGIDLNASEYINVRFYLRGTISNPKIETDILSTDQQKDFAQTLKEKAEERIQEEKEKTEEKVKESVKDVITSKVDSTSTEGDIIISTTEDILSSDSIGQEVGDIVKDKVDTLIDKTVKSKLDSLAKDLLKPKKDSTESVKDILDKYNPFKKKKKKKN